MSAQTTTYNKFATTIATSAALTIAIALDAPQSIAFSLVQEDLYFGRNIAGIGEVSEGQFQAFVDTTITPRFPDGLTIFNANGQFLNSSGLLVAEPAKVVSLYLENTPDSEVSISEIVGTYRQQFAQESVLQVVNKDDLKVSFGLGEDLFVNNSTPELIQADLFFGRNIPGGGEVSTSQFEGFVDNVITPRFPAGLTVLDADGQFLDSTGTTIKEPSKVVSLIFEDTLVNETSINQIVTAYVQQFNQKSILTVVDEEISVRFVESQPIPTPSSTIGLLLFGTLAIALRLKKKNSGTHC